MKNIRTLLFTACAVFWLICGCAKEQQFTAVEQICLADKGKAEAMRAAEEVLGEMRFSIEKSNVESGYIRSRPLVGGQFFEFWGSDIVGALNAAEANLHSIRRIVELDIRQEGEELCIGCDVNVQRLKLPERYVGSSSKAYAMFSKSNQSMQRLELNAEQRRGMAWIELGGDGRLETEILKQIEGRLKGESVNE